MSFNDQKLFLKSIHPFDEIPDSMIEDLIKNIEIAFYPSDESADICSDSSFRIIIKGEVKAEDNNGEIVRVYREKDSFDADALINGKCELRYIVTEDLICYEIDKKDFMQLFDSCEKFKKFYLMDIVDRIEYLKKRASHNDNIDWLRAKISEIYLHKPCIVDRDTPLIDALKESINMKRSEIIVSIGDNQYGIITDSDIKLLLTEGKFNDNIKVGDIAHFPLRTVNEDDFLFNAYLTIIRENIKRIGVTTNGGEIKGVIEQIDILSFFANQSHIITIQIERADSIDELRSAGLGYLTIIKRLNSQGLKVRYISKLISEINRKLFKRLFEIILPQELQSDCTLLVMGSEGRGEQIIRTDQDNALIIKNGIDTDVFTPYMEKFSQTLESFGYPPCPGKVMVNNPKWRKSLNDFKHEIDTWIDTPDEESFMNFAILFDAIGVAGNDNLSIELKEYIFNRFDNGNDLYLAMFAKLTLLFETPTGILSAILHKDRHIDIKKAGIFPIVQGVRALSLKYRIKSLSTVERLKELSREGIIEKSFAREIVEAFDTLSFLRLNRQLEEIARGEKPNNIIDSDELGKIRRDLLRDSLEIVERFKRFIEREFKLDRLPI